MSSWFVSQYLDHIYDSPAKYRKNIARVAKNIMKLKKKLKFTAIAFTGSSGAAYAYPVSAITGIHLIHVRKKESNHFGGVTEGGGTHSRYIILDDFIDSGATMRRIYNKIKVGTDSDDEDIKCVGIALYDKKSSYEEKEFKFNARTIVPVKKV